MECNVLGLYGPESSKYLHLVERRAALPPAAEEWGKQIWNLDRRCGERR